MGRISSPMVLHRVYYIVIVGFFLRYIQFCFSLCGFIFSEVKTMKTKSDCVEFCVPQARLISEYFAT
jgi:hypothetical protein